MSPLVPAPMTPQSNVLSASSSAGGSGSASTEAGGCGSCTTRGSANHVPGAPIAALGVGALAPIMRRHRRIE